MITSSKLLTAASTLLGAVYAIPAAAPSPTPALELRAEATDAWVTVDKTGLPSTVIPVVTVSDGAATTVSAIPTELTATSLIRTAFGEITTSVGTAPAEPTASNKKGKGSFLACTNPDEAIAPFCNPAASSSLYTGTTYYVTWDATALNGSRVSVVGRYINTTTGQIDEDEPAFTSDDIKASWSYYAWTPNKGYLKHGDGQAVNVTLTLNELDADGDTTGTNHTGPTVLVTKAPSYQQPSPSLPKGAALYIALPTVFGFVLIMICGVCIWNRKTRKIGLGNIMSRGRHGYGIAKSRARRMTLNVKSAAGGRRGRDKNAHHIRLDQVPEDQMYRDEPQAFDGRREYEYDADAQEVRMGGGGRGGHARRGSDGLGSLAGTPTSEQFPRQQTGNAFRDEMDRQQRERM